MIQIFDISNTDDISAHLAASFISHTYQVESTKTIVDLWDNIRNTLKPQDELDLVSAMLAAGRVMDYRFEIEDLNVINTIVTDIHTNLKSRSIESQDLQKELVWALITSFSISRSEQVESIRDIVDIWVQIREAVAINDDLDIISAVLTTGRLMELKIRAGGLDFITNIFMNIRKELSLQALERAVTRSELAAAFVAASYIEVSKKVEKIRDIVGSWLAISGSLEIKDNWDFISAILLTGKIKDVDALHIMDSDSLKKSHKKIKTQIEKIAGK